ncbi:MAG: FAD-dependent oxidoreductase [Deltaproteobacteria bacterium]|nr:FAD-dependent oxidoreductase [Deltaproteobacteria bacterium]
MSKGYIRSNLEMLSQIHGEKCWPLVETVSPCEDACPLHMDIPSYIVALSQGKIDEAYDVIRDTNPLPYICGTVCHQPCEDVCSRAMIDRPVAIKWLKRFVSEYQLKNGRKKVRPVKRSKKEKVAIIGSGPAGLTAAYDLIKQGYGVTIYEALPVAGGMLAAGIPDFILSKETVKAEVDYIKALGVDIKTDMRIGRDMTMDELWNQGYNAILVSTGAWKGAELPIPGTELKGVFNALQFLRDIKLEERKKVKGTVCIIGGGNVALDAARTALRLGAKKVVLTCLESRDDMPSFDWEIELAEKEGVEISPSLAPQAFTGRAGGKIRQVKFKKVARTSRNDDGKIEWELEDGPDTEIMMDADMVIVAIGQTADTSFVNGAELNSNGTFAIDTETMQTNIKGLFSAGDAVEVPGTVSDAMAAGRKAARSIGDYLQGKGTKSSKKKEEVKVFEFDEEIVPSFLARKDRWEMPSLPPKDAIRSFEEADLGYMQWQAIEEAKRCLNCRMCGNCLFGNSQICFESSVRLLAY